MACASHALYHSITKILLFLLSVSSASLVSPLPPPLLFLSLFWYEDESKLDPLQDLMHTSYNMRYGESPLKNLTREPLMAEMRRLAVLYLAATQAGAPSLSQAQMLCPPRFDFDVSSVTCYVKERKQHNPASIAIPPDGVNACS